MQIITINIDLCCCYTVDKEFVILAAQNAERLGWGLGGERRRRLLTMPHRPLGDATVSILP